MSVRDLRVWSGVKVKTEIMGILVWDGGLLLVG